MRRLKDAGYGRSVFIGIERGVCDQCNADALVFTCDNSDSEYCPLSICQPCVAAEFNVATPPK